MNAWSDLPNAKHIDAVIASVKAHPDKWVEAWEKAGRWTEVRNAAQNAAWNATCITARDAATAALEAVGDAADEVSGFAPSITVLALIAHDKCAHLLNTNPDHVKMMAGIGDEAAILLHPASLVFSEIENEHLV